MPLKSRRLAAAAALFVIAGCGSSDRRTALPPEPRIPHAVAQELARRADEIARRLDARDPCGALRAADALQRRSIALIGRVPQQYQETLQGAVNDIVERIDCVSVPTTSATTTITFTVSPPPKHAKKEHGKGHDKKHGPKHKERDD